MEDFDNNINNGYSNTESAAPKTETNYTNTAPQYNTPQFQQMNGYTRQQYQQPAPQRTYQQTYQQNPAYVSPYYGQQYQQTAQVQKTEKKSGASKGFVVGMIAICLILSIVLGALSAFVTYKVLGSGSNTSAKPSGDVVIKHEEGTPSTAVTDKGSYAYAASVALDSVVEIRTETITNNSIFGQYVTEGAGSGVIVSSTDSGTLIITCAHVIEGAKTVTVKLTNGEEYTGSFTAFDTITDIGVVKIDVGGLKTANVADSSKIVVGEQVIAIGNPLGELGGSVSNGIVSALEREVLIDGVTYSLFQTNAEINPGNSGGGLFDMNGNLIGIVNAKSAGTSIEGIGFAIPINGAITIFEELIQNGYVSGRVKIGVTLREILSNDDIYDSWSFYRKYFTDYGVYIEEAESSELHQGDRIISIDSIAVSSVAEIRQLLLEYHVGDVVEIQVSRLNSRNRPELVTVKITLTENKPQ